MHHADLEEGVAEILTLILGVQAARGGDLDSRSEPSWDSLHHVELLLAIEGAFGIHFEEQEMGSLRSQRLLVEAVQAHIAT